RSMPSKPMLISFIAALKKFSGRVPHIWATKGRSASVYRSRWLTCCSPFENIPSTLVNSVKKTAGLPHRAIICLSTVSVTSSIGARIKTGFFKWFQKFFMLKIVHADCTYGKRAGLLQKLFATALAPFTRVCELLLVSSLVRKEGKSFL